MRRIGRFGFGDRQTGELPASGQARQEDRDQGCLAGLPLAGQQGGGAAGQVSLPDPVDLLRGRAGEIAAGRLVKHAVDVAHTGVLYIRTLYVKWIFDQGFVVVKF